MCFDFDLVFVHEILHTFLKKKSTDCRLSRKVCSMHSVSKVKRLLCVLLLRDTGWSIQHSLRMLWHFIASAINGKSEFQSSQKYTQCVHIHKIAFAQHYFDLFRHSVRHCMTNVMSDRSAGEFTWVCHMLSGEWISEWLELRMCSIKLISCEISICVACTLTACN